MHALRLSLLLALGACKTPPPKQPPPQPKAPPPASASAEPEVSLSKPCPAAPPAWAAKRIPAADVATFDDGEAECVFLDAKTAWLALFEAAEPSPHVVVLRTEDGGGTFSRVTLGRGEPAYTTWAGGPRMEMHFRDAMRGELRVIDMPQHHNGHVRTEASFRTSDGGRTWVHARTQATCTEGPGGCHGG